MFPMLASVNKRMAMRHQFLTRTKNKNLRSMTMLVASHTRNTSCHLRVSNSILLSQTNQHWCNRLSSSWLPHSRLKTTIRRRRQLSVSTPYSPHHPGKFYHTPMTTSHVHIPIRTFTVSTGGFRRRAWNEISSRPIEFLSVPCVAAFVGILTNWMGVKMLFYPVDYHGLELKRWEKTPYGLFGWQGVVPTKTDLMAKRLVTIITEKLLSLDEAFDRLDPNQLSTLLLPGIEDYVAAALGGQESLTGRCYAWAVNQALQWLMPHLVTSLKREIDQVLDLEKVVLSAFVRDKATLVDLFQKVGRVELDFLVNSGFGLGFLLGLGQMVCWAAHPAAWTLPAAGALVGYVTNWIAIHMIFEPAEPVEILGGLVEIQGMFESRQVEVSDEFGDFMQKRVLTAADLLQDMALGGEDGDLYKFLRRHLPYPIPSEILTAAVDGIAKIAADPIKYANVHKYVNDRLDIRETLSRRLKTLSPTEFEDLLHPVFQEDEITLIATGGVLGFTAGGLQTQLGWGGINAVPRYVVSSS